MEGRSEPVIIINVARNYNRDRDTVYTDEGEFTATGYTIPGPGNTHNADALHELYGGRISIVMFLDAGIPDRVILDDAHGVRSGPEGEEPTTMQEDAIRIKRYVLDHHAN